MTDIASRLATDFIGAQGWCCILIQPIDSARRSIVTIGSVGDRDEPGVRLWLQRRQSDLAAVFSLAPEPSGRRDVDIGKLLTRMLTLG
jgi:hypothetical protein